MLDFLNRTVIQPLVAAKRRSRHLQYLQQLERTQFEAPEVMRERQLRMLQLQLQHAYETVPYYKRVWDANKIHPAAVQSLDDLKYFPILTKANIRMYAEELRSTQFTNAKVRIKKTSGSTGVPLTIHLDERGAQWKTACTLRADQWSGWRMGQRVAKVWGNPEYRQFGLKGRLSNAILDRAIYLDTIGLTEERIKEFVKSLRRHQPGLIFGHAHSLYLLACALKKSRIDDISPKGIISTAMPLHDWQRKVIEDVFHTKVTNRYGCEEVSIIACECSEHTGLHIAAESVYVEIKYGGTDIPVCEKSDTPQTRMSVPPIKTRNHTGPLLITDLSNFAMPLIRYQIGDVATLAEQPCKCGRGLPMLERIEGRDADYVLTPGGQLISGISLTENFALHITGAAQVQIVQETRTELRIRMVTDDAFNDVSQKQIKDLVIKMFGNTMRYDVELVDNIPQEPSGKYRFCISKVASEFMRGLSA